MPPGRQERVRVAIQTSEPKLTLTQVDIIQSLAEALAWFEKELSWGRLRPN